MLLIEPDRRLAGDYRQALEAAGHEVIWRATGQAAIESADRRTPDVIVLELQLKQHNGLEFLYELRSYREWQTVPVIVQSLVPATVFDGAAAWAHLGIRAYLYKPESSLRQLLKALATVPLPVAA